MNTLNDKLFSTVIKYNQNQEMLHFYDIIKDTEKISRLNELFNKVTFSNLNNKTVVMLQDMIELKVENLMLKGFDKAS